jgi:transposase
MAMGTRQHRQRQEKLWIATEEISTPVSHPFYARLNEILDEARFDEFVEKQCQKFYAGKMGRPSLAPGMYFRLLVVGYLEGIDSERGIAWRTDDSLSLRKRLRIPSIHGLRSSA